MNPRDATDYMQRDWAPAGASDRQYWSDRFRTDGWRVVWETAQALAAHVRSVQSDYPREAERARDLEHHVNLRRRLDRASHAFARR